MTAQRNITPSGKPDITRHKFYFETPLYDVILDEELSEEILSGEVDAYSNMYKNPTTYTISCFDVAESYYGEYAGYKRVTLKNKRKGDDILIFFVIRYADGFQKIGQQPSLASLQYSEITEKYSKLLDNENLKLFKKGIGLAAHGVGAGSFVYLRRIFEDLIKSTYEKHKDEIRISEEDFLRQRMTEKVETLQPYLPSQLVEMKTIYGILSSGVHELSEQDCLAYFQPLKLSIELILDQQLDEKIRIDRDKNVKEQIKHIEKMLKK